MEVLEFIKKAKSPVSKKEILEGTGFDGDFKAEIWKLRKVYPNELKSEGKTNNVKYFWVESKKKVVYSEMKNHEGYPDGTAGKAIANIMKSSSNGKYPMVQSFGEVWSCSKLVDSQEGFLVVSAKKGICIGYMVYPEKTPFMKPDYTMRWSDDNGKHYISTINPVNLSEKKLEKRIAKLKDSEKECLKTCLLNALSVDLPMQTKVVTKEIEKPVEVIKEVQVKDQALINENAEIRDQNKKLGNRIEELEKQLAVIELPELRPVEYRNDPAEIEAAVMKAKIEIYEKLIFGGIVVPQKLQAV